MERNLAPVFIYMEFKWLYKRMATSSYIDKWNLKLPTKKIWCKNEIFIFTFLFLYILYHNRAEIANSYYNY